MIPAVNIPFIKAVDAFLITLLFIAKKLNYVRQFVGFLYSGKCTQTLEGVATYTAGESMDQVKLMLEAEDAHKIHTDAKSVMTSCNRSRTSSKNRPLKTLTGTFF